MKKILIIEDCNAFRENLVEFLEMFGYEILSANNAETGVAIAKECVPDLIICDVLMPVMDGYGVLRLLAIFLQNNKIPFIFSSSKSEKQDYNEGMNLGADEYFVKPYDLAILLKKIQSCLIKASLEKKPSAIPLYNPCPEEVKINFPFQYTMMHIPQA